MNNANLKKKKPQIIMKYPCNGITKATGNVTILVPLFKVQYISEVRNPR